MRQYGFFKKKYPDCVLFFRMGDFYEMFDEDALLCHRVLGITLTQRTEGIPMAGVPYHSVESYLRRMIERGYRVAVCDQVQDPKEVKAGAIVERAVTRVLTPGTLVDDTLLNENLPNHLAALAFVESGDDPSARVGAAIVELSTGAFTLFDCRAADVVDELVRRRVNEVLFCANADGSTPPRVQRVLDLLRVPGTARASWHFRPGEAVEALTGHFKVATLAGFGLVGDDPAVPAAGAIMRYLLDTQAMDTAGLATSEGSSSGSASAMRMRVKTLGHLLPPKRESAEDGRLLIDAPGLRALEVEQTIRAAAGGTTRGAWAEGALLGVFARSAGTGGAEPACRGCSTAMGRRLLRDWLCRPSAKLGVINDRHACVGALVEDRARAMTLSGALDGVQDVARIGARVNLGRASPRDLVAMARSLARAAQIGESLRGASAFAARAAGLDRLATVLGPVAEKITRVCVDEPPAHLREGGLIRDGVDTVLDECRLLQRDSDTWLAEYQKSLIEKFNLPSLKVGFNKVFNYYIELPSAQAKRAPAEFSRRQTLTNAERFITPELKAFEDKVLSATDRAVKREGELFFELCSLVAGVAREVSTFGDLIAEIDVLACFASKAAHKGWVRPEMVEEPVLLISQGRHPVLESILGDAFVPNDVVLGRRRGTHGEASRHQEEVGTASLALITGPNMAGKSTFIRQVALITLLAHAGSFVPAQAATIGLTDRIFTRIGADDALHAGQSTFMVEMVETASILHHVTDRSLVVLDEIGRGTSTLDGLSLAWAIAEHLAGPAELGPAGRIGPAGLHDSGSKIHPRTLFATHYHELTDLEERLPGRVVNLHVAVKEWGEEIVFLHRIVPGRSSRSYGVHVARLAGLPKTVVQRAEELLESLSVSHASAGEAAKAADQAAQQRRGESRQFSLFTEFVPHPAVDALRDTALESLSPLQAFDALRELKKLAEQPAPEA